MANEITLQGNIPAYMQQYAPPAEARSAEYDVPGGAPLPILSLEGKAFTIKYRGELYPCRDDHGQNRQWLDIYIVQASERHTKTYWAAAFGQRQNSPPDCFSMDGIAPDPSSPSPQARKCQGCKHDAWGSSPQGGKGKACRDGKRMAVLQLDAIDGVMFDQEMGPQLLRIPPDSFNEFRLFVREQLQAGRWPHGIVTRVSFDPDERFRLNFGFQRWLDENEAQWIEVWRTVDEYAEKTQRVLAVSDWLVDGVDQELDAASAPVERPAPVQQTAAPTPARPQPQRPANAVQQPQRPQRPVAAAPAPEPEPEPELEPEPAPVVQARQPRRVPQPAQPPAQAAQAPRQAPVPAARAQAPQRPAAAAGGAPRAPGAANGNGAGNGGARPAPTRAPQRPPAAAAAPAAPVYVDDDGFDVDAVVEEVSTASIMDELDRAPGIPGN